MADVQDEVPDDVKRSLRAVGEALSALPSASHRREALAHYSRIREFMGATLATNVMLRGSEKQ